MPKEWEDLAQFWQKPEGGVKQGGAAKRGRLSVAIKVGISDYQFNWATVSQYQPTSKQNKYMPKGCLHFAAPLCI